MLIGRHDNTILVVGGIEPASAALLASALLAMAEPDPPDRAEQIAVFRLSSVQDARHELLATPKSKCQ
jgi:hypothetical protein